MTQLRDRGRAEGVDEHLLEDALDSDNPKETLIGFVDGAHAEQGSCRAYGDRMQEAGRRALM